MVLRFGLFFFCLLNLHSVYSQTVYDPLYRSVYPYLERTAQRGVIELHDVVLPLSRKDIAEYLHALQLKRSELTGLEKKELDYYLKEYTYETRMLFADSLIKEEGGLSLFTLAENDRPRILAMQSKKFTTNAQPIFGYEYRGNSDGEANNTLRAGFWAHGYIGKNVGYSLDYRTNIVKGEGIDYERTFTPEPGVIGQRNGEGDFVFTDMRASISYDWKWGTFSLAKDKMPIGYGYSGKTILSDKAPTFPLVRLDVKPLKWFTFNFAHIWLKSNLVDSSNIRYSGYGNRYQINEVPKKMAIHSFNITPFKGLSVLIGESIVYNDETKLTYLIPVSFFRSGAIQEGETKSTVHSNSQMFFQVSSRNHIPNTHIYTSYFIDEMNISKLRDRNQSAYNIGFSVTDVFLPNLTLGAEYFRSLPYSYVHHMNSLSYQHSGYNLGHWLGTNADQLIINLRYRFFRGLQLYGTYSKIRKGSEGHFGEQLQALGVPFLWGDVKKVNKLFAGAEFEMTSDLFFKINWTQEKTNSNLNNTSFSVGVTYGY